jgi:hypothetical protein
MNTSAPIAEPLLRRACSLRARPPDPPRTIGGRRLSFFMRLALSEGHWAPRAGLATRLCDFVTNRHEK